MVVVVEELFTLPRLKVKVKSVSISILLTVLKLSFFFFSYTFFSPCCAVFGVSRQFKQINSALSSQIRSDQSSATDDDDGDSGDDTVSPSLLLLSL